MESVIRHPQSPIFLVGFMCCGKSTVGEALAAKLSRSFIDLDKRIEAITDRTIADLIEQDGEERFRQIETQALHEVAHAPAAVVALGGGAIISPENRRLLETSGVSVWLDAPFELCWQRIQQDSTVRPLAPTEEEARARYMSRLPLYQQAKLRIEVSESQSTDEIVEAIIRQLVVDEPEKSKVVD
jgi:shikimate kinase